MNESLQGRIALVTGGSRNVGRNIALALARRGADVIITYREQKVAAAEVVGELHHLGVRAHAIAVDLNGTAQLDGFTADLQRLLHQWQAERLHILVNNAGTLRLGTFDAVGERDLDAIYQTNYKSLFFLTQRLAPLLADGGRIVNLGSRTAGIAFGPLVSYGPLKAAVQSLTLYLASYFGARGITVNAVAPGGLDDDFNAGLFERMPQARNYITGNTALKRIGVPQDVCDIVAFLCGPGASFINGAIVPVDGGYHL